MYYNFSCNTNYIRRDRIAKDVKWKTETEYGTLDITINLSKPEKDPKAIKCTEKAEFDFSGEIIAGSFPMKQAAIVKAWALIHQEELQADWELAMQDELPFRIDPLK